MNYIQFLEPMQEQFIKVYSTMSGIITVILILWAFNFLAGLIQRTYATGKAFGGFYRNHLHRYFKYTVMQILSMFNSKEKRFTT